VGWQKSSYVLVTDVDGDDGIEQGHIDWLLRAEQCYENCAHILLLRFLYALPNISYLKIKILKL
jgi:hypothetical protein